jgi:molecular chaperone GrpE (heat shock protein)
MDHLDPNAAYIEYINDQESPVIVCLECLESEDWEDRVKRRQTRDSRTGTRYDSGEKVLGAPASSRFSKILGLDWDYERQTSLAIEHWLFILRLAAVTAGALLVLVGVAIFAGVSGSIFVSMTTGLAWFGAAIELYRATWTFLVARPGLVLAGLGVAYFAHLYDYYRSIEPRAVDLGYTRPRWHYLAVFAAVGFIGGVGWSLINAGVLISSVLPVAVIAWSAGAVGLVYFLHYTLLEDRWSYGLRIRPALWKFPVQYTVALTVYDGLVGLPGPPVVASLTALVPPAVGLLYAGRRYLAFTETWLSVQQTLSRATRWRPGGRSPSDDAIWQSQEFGTAEKEGGTDTGRSQRRDERVEKLEAELARVTEELESLRASDSTQTDTDTDTQSDDLLTELFRLKANLERALDADGEVRDGVAAIDRQLERVLEREGIDLVEAEGSVDPTKHRVVGTVESSAHEPGEIVEVYRPGFRRGDQILQEAYVVVAADPESETTSNTDRGNPPDGRFDTEDRRGGSS